MKRMKHSMRPTPEDLLICARNAVRVAGGHALRHWATRRTEAIATFAHDIKLALDQECQTIAEHHIRRHYPNHAIMGEEDVGESGAAAEGTPYRWIIDPIDGTLNYSHGLPLWCCSIAVQYKGRTVAGAVYAPAMRELYSATINGPALCNGRPLRVSRIRRLGAAMVATGLDKNVDPNLAPLDVFRAISGATQRARILGSAALDICHVAAGHLDGFFENGIYIWDIAAGQLIVERAGGRTAIMAEATGGRLRFLAANKPVFLSLQHLIEHTLKSARHAGR